LQKLRGKCINNLRTFPPKFLQKPSPLFFMVHLLHRCYSRLLTSLLTCISRSPVSASARSPSLYSPSTTVPLTMVGGLHQYCWTWSVSTKYEVGGLRHWPDTPPPVASSTSGPARSARPRAAARRTTSAAAAAGGAAFDPPDLQANRLVSMPRPLLY